MLQCSSRQVWPASRCASPAPWSTPQSWAALARQGVHVILRDST